MLEESPAQLWGWLLSLPKEQLIIFGGGLALLVAVSKIMRFVFLVGILAISVAIVVPEVVKYYRAGSLPKVVENVGNREEMTPGRQVPANLEQRTYRQ